MGALRVMVAGARRTLGRVTGHSNARFSLDWPYSRLLRIEIDLLAGEACITREISVNPGDILELQIEPGLAGREGRRLRR